jgi:tRNA nucleotidyltransferase (CCA-adding enzyme)
LLKEEVNDIDITTDATPNEVMRLFNKAVPTGLKYGTVTVVHEHNKIEVTTFRLDGNYSDFRRPDEVELTNLETIDVKRRDFTVNGLLMDENYKVYDYVGGMEDLNNKVIRAIGNPNERFNEDALRMLRAIYFESKLGFEIEKETLEAIKENASKIKLLPNERVMTEMQKALTGKHQNEAIKSLYRSDLYKYLPGLEKGIEFIYKNINQNISVEVFYSLCFYLNGKVDTKWKFSNIDKNKYQKVLELLEKGKEFNYFTLYDYGIEINVLANLVLYYLGETDNKIKDIRYKFETMPLRSLTDLKVRGNDILKLTDKKRGAWLNKILNELAFKVLNGELKNDKKSLLKYCEEYLNEE